MAALARCIGYNAVVHHEDVNVMFTLLDAGKPAIVCVDINNTTTFLPDLLQGQHTHFAVVEGYFDVTIDDSDTTTTERYLLVKQSGRRAPVPSVWPLSVFLSSWVGDGWQGKYRKRAMPREVANRLQYDASADALKFDPTRTPLAGAALADMHAELIAKGVLLDATTSIDGDGALHRVRLAPERLLLHHEALRRKVLEVSI